MYIITRMYLYAYIYIYTHIYICMYMCICIYIYIYTHTCLAEERQDHLLQAVHLRLVRRDLHHEVRAQRLQVRHNIQYSM